jgi:hypothetical protein
MLASLLERRFDFAAPVESHFVRYFDALVRRLEPLSERELARLGSAVMCFLHRWVPVNNRVRSADRSLAYSLAALEAELPQILSNSRDFSGLVGNLFSGFAARERRIGWVEQSVYADPRDMNYLVHYPAGTKFIHLVRDGRDVWASWNQTWFRPASLTQTATWWRGHVIRARAWGLEHPRDYLELRYEDLLGDTEDVLQEMARFLDVALRSAAESRDSGLSDVLAVGGTHDRIGATPSLRSVGRWRNDMSAQELQRFERIAGDQLEAFGYQGRSGPADSTGRHSRLASSLENLRSGLSSNNIRRRLKRLLPYYCWLRAGKN